MGKKKRQNGTLGCSNPRRNRRIDDPFRNTLSSVGSEAGTPDPTTAADHPQSMTVQEAECKIASGILERLEGLTLDELIKTLQFIMDLEDHRDHGKVPDLGDLDLEEVPS